MQYISTRGGDKPLAFTETILAGLARDGGLYLPAAIPDVKGKLEEWRGLPYSDLAFEIIRLFADDIPADTLRELVERSYSGFRHSEVTPVVKAGPMYILELFHGPTLAFKDVALQFLGNLFSYALELHEREMNIVAATSGDTGSAAIYGVRGRPGIRIFVMQPRGRVSPVQERQMTTVLDDNVYNLAVDGTFDECQSIVKELFNDHKFRDECYLGAVNSINWARVLAQIVYYFYAAFRVQESEEADEISFAVPTGNFGDVFAGYIARCMGLPIRRLVLATNENDILARYFKSGVYSSGRVAATLSPSMDIQVASNFERYLYYLSGCDAGRVAEWMNEFAASGELRTPGYKHECIVAGRGDTPLTLATIREYWESYNYLLDPHTAVGVGVAAHYLEPGVPMVALATAHPAKFGSAIEQALGADLAHHPILEALADMPTRVVEVAADSSAVADMVREAVSKQ